MHILVEMSTIWQRVACRVDGEQTRLLPVTRTETGHPFVCTIQTPWLRQRESPEKKGPRYRERACDLPATVRPAQRHSGSCVSTIRARLGHRRIVVCTVFDAERFFVARLFRGRLDEVRSYHFNLQ